MMRTLMIGVATAGLLASVAGCSSTESPRWGYVGPDNTPGWKGQNFYAHQDGYVAMNYTNNDDYKVITICTPQPKLVEPGPSGAAGRVGLAGPPGPAGDVGVSGPRGRWAQRGRWVRPGHPDRPDGVPDLPVLPVRLECPVPRDREGPWGRGRRSTASTSSSRRLSSCRNV